MQKILTILIVFISLTTFGQSQFRITGFSDKYEANLTIAEGYEEEVFKKGEISIIDLKTKKAIITIESDELTFDLDTAGKVKTNVSELPYGEQSILIYKDVNFDGIEDLAIMDGQFSGYHLPSFQIYIETGNSLKHSPEFSDMASVSGMFHINYETEIISTMSKGGCCWHRYTDYKVIDGIPRPVKEITDDAMGLPTVTTKIIKWENGKSTETEEKIINIEDYPKVLTFKLAKNEKVVNLLIIGTQLHYALIKPGNVAEFSFPIGYAGIKPSFHINESEEHLTFKNKDAAYQIYEIRKQDKLKKIGILVTVNGKEYDLAGDITTAKGSIHNKKLAELSNVAKEEAIP